MTEQFVILAISPFVGSFLANLVVRLPAGEGFVFSRSKCRTCEEKLTWWELVPLLSWLRQGGKCQHCGALISKLYPLIELASLAIAIWTVMVLPNGLLLWSSCVLGWILLTQAVIDWRTLVLPDSLTLPLLPIGLAMTWWRVPDQVFWHLAASTATAALLLFLRYVISRLKNQEALGLGDVKLAAGAAAWLGPIGIVSALAWASISGLIYGLWQRRKGDSEKTPVIPFGPFLALGFWLTWLYGPIVLGTYH